MDSITLNHTVPDFVLPATDNQSIRLSDLRGKNIVLYFYPKDCTSGCTLEGQGFRDYYTDFKKHNTEILGISRDSIKLHEKFKAEQNFPFPLLSDPEGKICDLFGVMKEKNMYGKKVLGIERSTFLMNPQGILIHEWRNVKVEGHVEEVLKLIKAM